MPTPPHTPAQGGRDWFKVVAIVALVLGGLAMVGGLVLVVAAFLLVG